LWTDYGRVLTLKLGLFAALLALGAFNLVWVRPRLTAGEHDASGPSGAEVLRRFGRALRLEALLGLAVLLVVAVLTGLVPGREARRRPLPGRRTVPEHGRAVADPRDRAPRRPGRRDRELPADDRRGGRAGPARVGRGDPGALSRAGAAGRGAAAGARGGAPA